MRTLFKSLSAERRGATAIEIGLIATFISVAMVAALPGIMTNIGNKPSPVHTELA